MSSIVKLIRRPFQLGPADVPILGAFARYVFLTAEQLQRLLYAPSSRSHAQARLKRLVDTGVLVRIMLPRPTRTGSAPFVYTLSRSGRRACAAWGVPVIRRLRPTEAWKHSYLHLAHTLALNDVVIALELLSQTHPSLQIANVRHERELKQRPLRVSPAGEKYVAVIPDAWVDLRLAARYRECYWIELDRGTTGQRAWRRKVAALVAATRGPYQRAFGTAALTITVVASTGEHRRDELLRWTEHALWAAGMAEDAVLFRFTGASVTQVGPTCFIADAHWYIPFVATGQPLIDLSDEDLLVSDAAHTRGSVYSGISYISDITEMSEQAEFADNEEQTAPIARTQHSSSERDRTGEGDR